MSISEHWALLKAEDEVRDLEAKLKAAEVKAARVVAARKVAKDLSARAYKWTEAEAEQYILAEKEWLAALDALSEQREMVGG